MPTVHTLDFIPSNSFACISYLLYINIHIYYREKGRVIGGTKGNKVLEYISGAPVKAQIVDRIPNIFDYDELTRYGYSVRIRIVVLL
jgi:hypothetical protein